jgi:arylsulfatase A-like enzyme
MPTPDDPEFATWNPQKDKSDPKFFPSMVAYMDKKVGELINEVNALGITDKTIIIYAGDNGTDNQISSVFLGENFQGGKGRTIEAGTHVPLIIDWPGHITPGSINNNMVDFVDFLPTLADLAKIQLVPDSCDGISFYPQLFGVDDTARHWSYCYYNPYLPAVSDLRRWVQDTTYKLYSTENFFDMKLDNWETHPIGAGRLTPSQLTIKNDFQYLLDSLPNR